MEILLTRLHAIVFYILTLEENFWQRKNKNKQCHKGIIEKSLEKLKYQVAFGHHMV